MYMAYYTGWQLSEILNLPYWEFLEIYNDARKMFDQKPKKDMK